MTIAVESRGNGLLAILVILTLLALAGCGPSPEDLATEDYTPLPGDDWEVSSPEAEGLDPDMVAELYYDKEESTIRHLLQMRSGYPWKESHPDLWEGLLTRGFRSHMVHYPLVTDPGTRFHYSNASSDLLGMIVARACDVDHREFAKEHPFAPIGGIRPEAAATRRCWWSSWDSPLCP